MRISTTMAHQQGLSAILDQQSKLQHTQLQLSTGRRVVTPSDDPVASTLALELEQIKSRNDQFDKNADFAENRLSFAETTLGNIIDSLQRIRELGVQALNDTQSAADRVSVATEVEEIYEGLIALANSSDGAGEYIFAGFQADKPPFLRQPAGVQYNGDQGQRFIQLSDSRKVAATDSGFEVFGKIPSATGPTDLFSMVRGFMEGLNADAPDPSVLSDMDAAMEHLDLFRAKIGGRRNAIDDQRNINESYGIDLERAKSELVDLDYAEAISRMNLQMAGFEAAQATFTRVRQLSLFNYL